MKESLAVRLEAALNQKDDKVERALMGLLMCLFFFVTLGKLPVFVSILTALTVVGLVMVPTGPARR